MSNNLIEDKLLKVIRDSEREIARNSATNTKLPTCLQNIRDATARINDDLTDCMVNSETNTKNDYLKCLNNTYSQVNAAYKNIIMSDDCLKGGVVNRRKALIYLGALWQLGSIRSCLEKNDYTVAAKCIKNKIGWILPEDMGETIKNDKDNSNKKKKKKNKKNKLTIS